MYENTTNENSDLICILSIETFTINQYQLFIFYPKFKLNNLVLYSIKIFLWNRHDLLNTKTNEDIKRLTSLKSTSLGLDMT